ncbi:WD40 repeat domain-containing serine/threonine protein kinase [Thermobifida cellulosilytica]|uniref:Protein kinase domain-containing protein n=1 Tax=Thermobifida cellulosilytica TB100 TaxID=665004 RepID=A0A147KGS1_THECS|nr:serine/threonine-protein kinase [Thermobifida cellulosilytica]KUP96493.1 hypothetical protein AC529_12120 [Thermobifida cellulosilytica TB100]
MEPLRSGDPERVGPYRLVGRLGAGGMGQVFLARSPGGRPVVVKVIRPEYAADREYRARFAREVEAARRVGGFHTAQVVDADPNADSPWMAAAYVPGPSLQQAVQQRGALDEHALRILAAGLIEGLAAIHSCGLVHRDFKPGNIILAADGPRIIDFGIARPTDASTMTLSGAVMGTLAYMSPEQIGGGQVGPPSDVFSLGSVLAFAATGQSPFAADGIGEVVMRIVSKPPELPQLPDDLRRLIHACWRQAPDERPTTADLLAQLSTAQTSHDWPPPGLADLVNSETPGPASPPNLPNPPNPPKPPPAAMGPPRPYTPAAPPNQPFHQGGEEGRFGPVPVQAAPPPVWFPPAAQPPPRQRFFSWRGVLVGGAAATAVVGLVAALAVLLLLRPTPSQRVLEVDAEVNSVVFSPDGSVLAGAGGDNTVRLWDAGTGEELAELEGHTDWVRSVAFSPDGSVLASASYDRTVRLWDAETGAQRAALEGHTDWVNSVAFSPDGSVLASGSDDGTVRLWDAGTGEELAELDGHPNVVNSVAFSPDGSVLASGSGDNTVRLWDTGTGEELAELEGHADWVRSVAFSPNGSLLASASDDGTVRLWDAGTGEELAELEGHTDWVRSVAFSPNGSLLASASDDGTVRLWDAGTRKELGRLEGHIGWTTSVAFSPNGSQVASAGNDGTVRLWPVDVE